LFAQKCISIASERTDSGQACTFLGPLITPLLNIDQQKEFQAIREEHRRELIEKIGGQLVQKAENSVSGFFDQHAQSHK